jgi:hypothetical protein
MQPLRRLLAVMASATLCLIVVAPANADGPTSGLLVITTDHLDPGTPFTVLGSRIDPGATVTFRLDTDTRTLQLGDASVAQDGTLSVTFQLAPDAPLGDAWLRGRTTTGVDLELYVHVGPRAVSPGASGEPADITTPVDDRGIGLVLAGIGTLLFLIAAAWYIRSRPSGSTGTG